MDTRGGFELPREGEVQPPHAQVQVQEAEKQQQQQQQQQQQPPAKALSDRQQTRLSAYLDDALTAISRGFLRRHEPARTHTRSGDQAEGGEWLPTVPLLLVSWAHVLGLIVRIPPLGSSAPLLVSYLLRTTSDLTEQVTGYNLGERDLKRNGDGATPTLEDQLHAILALLDLLDHIWADLLRGQPIQQHQHTLSHFSTTSKSTSDGAQSVGGLSTDPSGRFHHAAPAEPRPLLHAFPPAPNTPHRPHPAHGPSAASALSQTERIRLRNLVLLARDRLFRWMRDVLDAPPPPEIDEAGGKGDGDGNGNGNRTEKGKDGDELGALGHGSRVAVLLDYDKTQRKRRANKRRKIGAAAAGGEEEEGDAALERQEREFAELAGEQGDLDAGLGPLGDEPVDEPEDDGNIGEDGRQPGGSRGQVEKADDEDIPEMVDVIDVEDPAPPTGGAASLRELGTGGESDRACRDPREDDDEGGQMGEEHRHYADLFSRKVSSNVCPAGLRFADLACLTVTAVFISFFQLDPDASDDEEDDDEDAAEGREEDDGDERKHQAAHGRHKRLRSDSGSINSADAHTIDVSKSAPSAAVVVGQWDLEFSRCFRRTLRLLAEADDRARAAEVEREEGQAAEP
ncbi:hypothetical protein OC842_004953 [Tilletia horrida]|uniref:Uncharacterized protein n=1 Tax=Tilletia horrida TaxID=155126 RepID=A0AAN6G8P4_9BASI|nr:hypothetical protein OC842_004953 [Tilletia horrida]